MSFILLDSSLKNLFNCKPEVLFRSGNLVDKSLLLKRMVYKYSLVGINALIYLSANYLKFLLHKFKHLSYIRPSSSALHITFSTPSSIFDGASKRALALTPSGAFFIA